MIPIGTPIHLTEQAICGQVDADLFFPERGTSAREAKAVCLACPVRPECLDWALDNGEMFGIWGGLTERERRRLRRPAAGWTSDEQALHRAELLAALKPAA